MGAARYNWMFRTAAVLFVMFGVFWLFDATFTKKFTGARPYLLAGGVAAIAVGVMLFRRMKTGIALSALCAALLSISAAVTAPQMRGPGILVVAAVAIMTALYAALATRELYGGK